ncbi:MAG TPA: metalloregulator ArsR/SmtB family transcription factor [Acidimicrobiia bacterium]|nr:metalloregulator ArsR/SmtB family transcription factor [Acidimicrobiia bacterium]
MAYSDALTALADPTRRSVFERLAGGDRSVGEIAAELPVSRPAVSQHLRVLKEAGLIGERQVGTRRYYSLRRDGLVELRDYVEGFWEEALASFKRTAERGEEDETSDG